MDAVFELKTNKSIDEAVAALKEQLSIIKFGILFEMSFKDTLEKMVWILIKNSLF